MKNNGFTPFRDEQGKMGIGLSTLGVNNKSDFLKRCKLRLPNGNLSLTGFTLIELMLVVIIIGTLAALVIPRLAGRAEQARVTAAKADILSNIPLALDLYELDNGAYPTTQQGLDALVESPNTSPLAKNWNGPYLKKKPVDPWGNPYNYVYPGVNNKDDYDLFSVGKDGAEGGSDDIGNWED